MPTYLDFERPLVELEEKIAELTSFSQEKGLDLSEEIAKLHQRAEELKRQIFAHLTPWQKVQLARHPDRPTTLDYIRLLCEEFTELHGDRLYGDDPAIVGGIAWFAGRPVMVLGHQKGKDTRENMRRNFGMPHPEGFRKALRLMLQAEKFGRPIITFIDTPGAYCGIGAEERGQSVAIAQNLARMSSLRVPIIVVVIGEGGSGGALALAVGDRILMQEHAIFSVISPEGCASILWKDASRAKEAAEALKLTAQDLLALGLIDEVIPEPLGGAHRNREGAAEFLREALLRHLEELEGIPPDELCRQRYAKYRRVGPTFYQGEREA
ncbi:acetyl-CoA carboxylase, carboxyl transferase, alpha subunit [Ammonifex degensii KC4]|uniref:Acetyl-coenzyme A carboxylase carboxyl transferase subunit alpha n=1 Tax=Ammonifex degensii (strain DSM 10501 / KC4) TaxID=429009 RepID=C9RBG3_AMMDK|nr:acetyl-CoA carboxylase carboxyltransferase subunit alpha [Ammonifex degensii]ACX51590.1 acetyl-CoA carboxylase, carboxyl transferase, alpha subunit [Ammonifex degensii KC4]